MAYAPPDPKKVEARRLALEKAARDEIRHIEKEQRRVKAEIRACYFDGVTEVNGRKATGYIPKQIKHAGTMMRDGKASDNLREAVYEGLACWEVLGRSNGGRTRGKLMRCAYV